MKKVSAVVGGILGIVVVRFVMTYSGSENVVAESRSEAWPEAFKAEFFDGCVESFLEEAGENFHARANDIAHHYCHCAQKKIEDAKVISTKYNKYKENQKQAVQRLAAETGSFIKTEAGQKIINECVETTRTAFNIKASNQSN